MSASYSVQQVGGSGTSSSSSTSLSSLPLNNEAVFRIELSFSSRKSSVIVMRCTARLYSLEGVNGTEKGEEPGESCCEQGVGRCGRLIAKPAPEGGGVSEGGRSKRGWGRYPGGGAGNQATGV